MVREQKVQDHRVKSQEGRFFCLPATQMMKYACSSEYHKISGTRLTSFNPGFIRLKAADFCR